MSEQVQSAVGSGHISLETGVTAKGEPTYGAKIVMPFVSPDHPEHGALVERLRILAQEQLEAAETFLRERYGRAQS